MQLFHGIVTTIRDISSSNRIYTVIIPEKGISVRAKSGTMLELLEPVQLSTHDKNGLYEAEPTDKHYSEYQTALQEVCLRLRIQEPSLPDIGKHGVDMSLALNAQIIAAASRIIRNIASGAPISVHFHSDGDGSTGAIGLYRGIRAASSAMQADYKAIKWEAVRGIAYAEDSLYADELFFKSFSSAERPITLITDFGSSPESNRSIKHLAEISDIIWIDHHPPDKGFVQPESLYINPWNHGGDSSLSAGFITCMLGSAMGADNVEDMMLVSLISDHTSLAKPDKTNEEKAAVLDAINIHNPDGVPNTPQYMEAVLSDAAKFSHILSESTAQMDEATSIGLRCGKRVMSKMGFPIFILNFEKVAKMKFSYIKMGKYTSTLHSVLEKDGTQLVTIVYHNRYISARASKRIASTSILIETVRKMSEDKEEVENAGGHMEAVSMRLADNNAAEISKKFASYLGAQPSAALL